MSHDRARDALRATAVLSIACGVYTSRCPFAHVSLGPRTMSYRAVVYALAGVWVALMGLSLALSLGVEAEGDGFTRGLNRIASFLTWQAVAFVVAIVAAALARVGSARGVERIKLAGYLPLAASVFIVGALVVMIAFRVLVQPAFA
jgi:hypothetical protein